MPTKYIINNEDNLLPQQSISGDLIVTNEISATKIYGDTLTGNTIYSNALTGNTIYSNAFIGDGSQLGGVVGLTYTELGFTITSPTPSSINQNVVLPYNSTVTYPTPLNVGSGYTISIPEGTTLTII